jgi:hypothetical protein
MAVFGAAAPRRLTIHHHDPIPIGKQAQAACRELWMRLNALNVFGPRYVRV